MFPSHIYTDDKTVLPDWIKKSLGHIGSNYFMQSCNIMHAFSKILILPKYEICDF